MKEESSSVDKKTIQILLEYFRVKQDSSSKRIYYLEFLTYLACCSTWNITTRIKSLEISLRLKNVLKESFSKKGSGNGVMALTTGTHKKIDSLKFIEILLSVGILIPEVSAVVLYYQHGGKHKTIDSTTLYGIISNELDGDRDRDRDRDSGDYRRQSVTTFELHSHDKCEYTKRILGEYDNLVTKAVQLAFDMFDADTTNQIPLNEVERYSLLLVTH